ncbi:MAG: hypothetical protein AB7D46_05710 [Flavobacteriaceae bacterium]
MELKISENQYTKLILEILSSENFKNKLSLINNSYSNLKQEGLIRNSILEELNSYFLSKSKNIRAFAEHPRENNTRVDLSIVNLENIKNPFKVEFKFQFSKDNKNLKNYWKVIQKDYEIRNSNLFILIVAHWNKQEKKEFDKKWGISSNLSRYLSSNDDWKTNIIESFNLFKDTEFVEFEKIEIEKPYKTDYHIYILSRKQKLIL